MGETPQPRGGTMIGVGLKRFLGLGFGLGVGSYCYAKTAQLPSVFSGAEKKLRTFLTRPSDEPSTAARAEFEAQWNLEVVANVAHEAVQEEPSRSGPEDVWLLQPVEVRQGVQEQGLQQGGGGGEGGVDFGLRNRQQFIPSPLQDETVSSTTPDL